MAQRDSGLLILCRTLAASSQCGGLIINKQQLQESTTDKQTVGDPLASVATTHTVVDWPVKRLRKDDFCVSPRLLLPPPLPLPTPLPSPAPTHPGKKTESAWTPKKTKRKKRDKLSVIPYLILCNEDLRPPSPLPRATMAPPTTPSPPMNDHFYVSKSIDDDQSRVWKKTCEL